MARQDIHRPSAIIPADYEFVGIEHQKIEGFGDVFAVQAERARIQAHMQQTGGTYSAHEHGGNCHVCGAHCIYTALFYHAQTNTYIRTGFDCAAKMEMGDERRFRAYKDAIEAAKLARAGKMKAEGILREAGLEKAWVIYRTFAHRTTQGWAGSAAVAAGLVPETDAAIVADWYEEKYHFAAAGLREFAINGRLPFEESTIEDIVSKLVQYGSLSPKQMQFLGSLVRKIEERPERKAKIAAEKAAAVDVPEGRQTVKVEVIKTDWRDTAFGTTLKMLCKAIDGGFTLWGTVPSAVQTIATPEGSRGIERGDRLELTATLERSDKDAKFGFFKRPYAKLI